MDAGPQQCCSSSLALDFCSVGAEAASVMMQREGPGWAGGGTIPSLLTTRFSTEGWDGEGRCWVEEGHQKK